MQLLALNNINKIKFGNRADEVMRSILELAKTSNDKGVKDNSVELLKHLLKDAAKEIRDEAKKHLGESVLS